jgi:hypothetical protein
MRSDSSEPGWGSRVILTKSIGSSIKLLRAPIKIRYMDQCCQRDIAWRPSRVILVSLLNSGIHPLLGTRLRHRLVLPSAHKPALSQRVHHHLHLEVQRIRPIYHHIREIDQRADERQSTGPHRGIILMSNGIRLPAPFLYIPLEPPAVSTYTLNWYNRLSSGKYSVNNPSTTTRLPGWIVSASPGMRMYSAKL